MGKVFKIVFLTIAALFIFNISYVYAEEFEPSDLIEEVKKDEVETIDNSNVNNQIVLESDELEEQEEQEELIEEPKREVPQEEQDEEQEPIEENKEPEVAEVLNENEEKTDVESEEPTSEEPKSEEPKTEDAVAEGNATTEDVHGGVIYDIQKVIVKILKINEATNETLPGAKLQLLDCNGTEIASWTSGTEAYEIQLPNGTYTVRELEAPEGFDIAEDKTFTVEVKIVELDAGSNPSATPCPHYTGTQMYYVKIAGKEHEVYCINQNWDTPDENSTYNGTILDSDSIRNYTKQTTVVGISDTDARKAVFSDGPIDVSDQSLNDEELYNKILDIIYHRNIALQMLEDSYTTEELRFVTEVALKNYTNPGLAELQGTRKTQALIDQLDAAGVTYGFYGTSYVYYIKHNYRDFVYTPDVPLGQNIYKMDYGKGNSFGQMVAAHWNYYSDTNETHLHPDANVTTQAHNAKNKQAERDTVARYYRLYLFLIGEENPHPTDMNLYIYSSDSVPSDPAGNNYDNRYQSLLGITGYFEDVEQQEQEVVVSNSYSTKTRDITVEKIWDDKEDYNKQRPMSVKVELYAGEEIIDTVELNNDNGWTYTWEKLPCYKEGSEIKYTVNEEEVPGYFTTIEDENMDEIFYITNTYFGTGGDEPPTDNPQTGDSIMIYITMLLISLLGLFNYTYSYVKNN